MATCLCPGWPACREQQWKSHSVEVGDARWFPTGCCCVGRGGWCDSLEINPPAHSIVCVCTAGVLSIELPCRESWRGDGAPPPMNCLGGIMLAPGATPLCVVSWLPLAAASLESLSAVITVTWGAAVPATTFLCGSFELTWSSLAVSLSVELFVGRISLASLVASRLCRGPYPPSKLFWCPVPWNYNMI